jgi:hypothetical protein
MRVLHACAAAGFGTREKTAAVYAMVSDWRSGMETSATRESVCRGAEMNMAWDLVPEQQENKGTLFKWKSVPFAKKGDWKNCAVV